jgi:hypothetical protein
VDGEELWKLPPPGTQSSQSPAAPSVPYLGPVNLALVSSAPCAGGQVELSGERLETIEGVSVDGKSVDFELLENGNLRYSLKDMVPGTYQVRYTVPVSGLVLTSQITVQTCAGEADTNEGLGKVNVGSFNGKLVVYALGLDQSRITWKVGGIWGQDFAEGNTLNRFDRLTPRRGVTVTVDIFVDGKRQLTKSVLTR